jgi:hypothetical protein
MESHSCKKTGGGGPSSNTLSPDPAPIVDLPPVEPEVESGERALCRHIDAQGRRCRMLVMSIEADFCAYHTQRQSQRSSEAAQQLLACGTDFGDAASVNRFLGALVRQVTLKRIPRRDAITLAYICQLLLNSLGAINREEALRLEESRLQALQAQEAASPDHLGYSRAAIRAADPLEATLAKKASKDESSR